MLQTNSGNPYNEHQFQSVRQGRSNSLQSINSASATSGQILDSSYNARSNSLTKNEDVDQQAKEGKDSIEIVNIALEQKTLPKVASADDKTLLVQYQHNESDQKLQQPNIVIEQDKLLEPSIEFAPEQAVQKSIRRRPKKVKKNQNTHEIPDFLVQGQDTSCKCQICLYQLRILRSDGLDPTVQDIMHQKQKHDKLLKKQPACDARMEEVQSKQQEQTKLSSAQKEGDFNFQQDILQEMERIRETNKISFKKGDHFIYEEQTYNWLLQKLASTADSTYLGCPVNVTETVIFKNGKANKVIKTTREDGLVNQIKGPLGNLTEQKRYLLSLATERNKEYQRKVQQLKFEEAARLKRKALEKAQQKLLQATRGKNSLMGTGGGFDSSQFGAVSQESRESKEEDSALGNQETQQEMKDKRDAFLVRFKKGSELCDKVLTEKALTKELYTTDRRESDQCIQDLNSITLTPIAKSGLGKLFTFEFIAPCFETGKVKSKKQAIKNESMSYYGKVHYNFQQFGTDDEQLKKERPLQYCLKMCHIMGFYLQRAHGFEVLRMNVDFNQDQFGEIWLMQVENLFVRKSRYVPDDGGPKVADYVLSKVQQMEREEARKQLAQEKKLARLMREQQESPKDMNRLQGGKRAKSIADHTVLSIGNRQSNSLRRNTFSLTGNNTVTNTNRPQSILSNNQQDKNNDPMEVFKRIHPQFNNVGQGLNNSPIDESWIPDLDQSVQKQYRYPQTQFTSKVVSKDNLASAERSQSQQQGADPLMQISRASYLNDSDNVHRINQLKELRLSLNKLREHNSTTNATNSTTVDNVNLQSTSEYPQKENSGSTERSMNKQNHFSSSYITFCKENNNQMTSQLTPIIDYETSTVRSRIQKKLPQSKASGSAVPVKRNQTKSLREVERLLSDAGRLKQDCSQVDPFTQQKAKNTLQTQCPLIKQENVIKNVQTEAKRYQEFRKKHMFQVRSMQSDEQNQLTESSYHLKSAQQKPKTNPLKHTHSNYRESGSMSQRPRNMKAIKSQQHQKNSQSLRENNSYDSRAIGTDPLQDSQIKSGAAGATTSSLLPSMNPFASGEALEQFEVKKAQREQEQTDEGELGAIAKQFRSVDMENPYLRDFSRMHAKSKRMREVLFSNQLNLQMRCDFLKMSTESQQSSTIESMTSAEEKPQKEHPMLKYKQMTAEYQAMEEQKSKKLANDYEKALNSKPEIGHMEQQGRPQEQQPAINILKVDSLSTQDNQLANQEESQQYEQPTKLDRQSKALNGEASELQSVTDIKEAVPTERNDSIFMDFKESRSKPPLVVETLSQPVAEVVTCLGAEDCEGMPNQKARNFAKFIMNTKENKHMYSALKQTAHKIKSQGKHSALNHPRSNFPAGSPSVGYQNESTRNGQSTKQQTSELESKINGTGMIMIGTRSTSQKPVTSYNAWPYAGGRGSSHRRSRDSKPMSNQKARALVQQDYFLQRQGNSHKLLAASKNRTNVDDSSNHFISGTLLSNDMYNNPTFSYEAFLNQPTAVKSNMKLGMASKGKNSLVGRGNAISPFGVVQGVSNPSGGKQQRNPSTLISQSEMGGTTHYGTFAAISTSNRHQKTKGLSGLNVAENTSQSAMRSINSELQNHEFATHQSNVLNLGKNSNQRKVVNLSLLKNMNNQSQLTAAINPHASSFLNQPSSSHSTQSFQKDPVPHTKNRSSYGRYTGLGQYQNSKPSYFFQGI